MASILAETNFDNDHANELFNHILTASTVPRFFAADADGSAPTAKDPAEAPTDSTAGQDLAPAPAPVNLPSGDKFDKLVALMSQPLTPAAALKAGNLPSPKTNVKIVSKEDEGDSKAMEVHDALDALIGLSDLYAGILSVARGEKVVKMSEQEGAAKAFAQQADDAWAAIKGPLSGLVLLEKLKTENWTSSAIDVELHNELLSKLFSGFSVGVDAMKQLEELLKSIADGLSHIDWSAAEAEYTIDYFVRTNSIRRVNEGTPEEPIKFMEGFTTFFLLKMQQSSFKTAWNSKGSSGTITKDYFQMQITSVEGRVNLDLYNANKNKLDGISNIVVGKNLAEYGKDISNTVTD